MLPSDVSPSRGIFRLSDRAEASNRFARISSPSGFDRSASRRYFRVFAWSSTEPPWLESGLIAGEEGLDRTLAIQLLAHWRRLPEWAGLGAFDEIATRPGLVAKLGFARRVLLPRPREFRLASREGGAAGARLKHAAAAVAAGVDAALHRSWRARRRGGSLKRELHHRRAARRE